MDNYQFDYFKFQQRLRFGAFQTLDHFFGRTRVQRLFSRARHRLFLDFQTTLQRRGPAREIQIDRRSNLTPDEFRKEYLAINKPVILEKAAQHWKCTKEWNLDYFKKHFGEDEILTVDTLDASTPHTSLRLGEALENLDGDNISTYVRFYNLLEHHPECISHLDYNWLRSLRHKRVISEAWQVFLGAKGHMTNMHNATASNLFVMAHGSKTWILYPMYFAPIVDPIATKSGVYRAAPWRNGAPFNPFDPDYEAHPLYAYADRFVAHLEEGDVLFNPSYWWHTVRNETDSIGIGYRWINPGYCLRNHPLYFLLDLTARNPSFFKSVRLWNSSVNKVFVAERK